MNLLSHRGKWRRVALWLMLVLSAGVRGYGQTNMPVSGYYFSTGVDSSMWEDYPSYIYMGMDSNVPAISGFDFYFGRGFVSEMSLSRHGLIYIDNSFAGENTTDTLFSDSASLSQAPFMAPVGNSSDITISTWRSWQREGPDGKVYVLELTIQVGYGDTMSFRQMQVQLREDKSVTFVYAMLPDSNVVDIQLGLAVSPTEIVAIDQLTHTVSSVAPPLQGRGWPGEWRYYRFDPDCDIPDSLSVDMVTTTTMRARWNGTGTYWVEYDTAGFVPGTGIGQVVTGNEVLIQNINSEFMYDVYVRAYCDDSLYGLLNRVRIEPSCIINNGSIDRIRCWDLERDNVVRHCGTFNNPDNSLGGTVGHGLNNYRFSIHDDVSERDTYTGGILHTVCPGHCRSVRLGNGLAGAQQESIEYMLTVDTDDYDLLILNYAVVEENPNHELPYQPYFTFAICDAQGTLIDSCYFANFIAGNLSGWNRLDYYEDQYLLNIVWRDWSSVGVDLVPLHGQSVRVRISNADCAYGAHFGYGYFTLENGHRRLRMASCGDVEENTLYAPKGFTYRWYRADNPGVTLSTADSLHVTVGGYYCCRANYQLSGQNCGFTVSAYVGIRFPVAAFHTEYLDSCGRHVRFVNESFVAHDSARTMVSTEPCESYRWEVDGVAVSESSSPVHELDEGTHIVTLYAMLGDGQCVDSVSHTVVVSLQHDTVYDTVCPHLSYSWYGVWVRDSGAHYAVDGCEGHLLQLSYYDTAFVEIYDTVCQGNGVEFFGSDYYSTGDYSNYSMRGGCDTVTRLHLHVSPPPVTQVVDTFQLGSVYHYGMEDYMWPGVYRQVLSTAEGCDSVCVLRLGSIERHDTTICVDGLPLGWRGGYFAHAGIDTLALACQGGTDSIVVLRLSVRQHPVSHFVAEPYCEEDGYYLVPLADTLTYRWTAQPGDNQLPSDIVMGGNYPLGIRLEPTDHTFYYIVTDYADSPHCPVADTLLLQPVRVVGSHIDVSAAELWGDNPELTAVDLGDTSWGREWYINGLLQGERGMVLRYRANVGEDSLQIMLVNYSELCSDTAYVSVLVKRQELWFPNVFTPDDATNNLFRGYGVNIDQYDLQIYTKWGNRIFHTQNMEEGWDGTCNGVRSPVSAYVYKCRYTTFDGERKTVVGTVTLLR